jgi:hypothetical protein
LHEKGLLPECYGLQLFCVSLSQKKDFLSVQFALGTGCSNLAIFVKFLQVRLLFGEDYEYLYICKLKNGGLAQLARALAWHVRGHRFDPDILHPKEALKVCSNAGLFCWN